MRSFNGLVVSVLATALEGRGFKLGRCDGFLREIKKTAANLPSEGK
jgi:hypothetical protein